MNQNNYKKVCVITNYKNTGNYGAVLQAYALNKKINDMGFTCETLNFSAAEQNGSKILRYVKRIINGEINLLIDDLKRDFFKLLIRPRITSRLDSLKTFKDNIPHTKYYTIDKIYEINKLYDCFICGSDQIWRPTFEGNLIGIYWLDVINQEHLKASYAASIGLTTLPESILDKAKGYLQSFDYISVREPAAKEILSKVIDKDIEITIDPVFLLEKKEWDSMAKKPKIDEPYIFVYMIHGTRKLLNSIIKFAKMENLKIVTFPYMAYYFRMTEFSFGDIKIFDADPADFLGYIKDAEFVFTDSFHATAFSIIFHKCFFSSSANEIAFSRIKYLLSLTGLNNRHIPSEGLPPDNYRNISQVDWRNVDSKLDYAVSNSLNYLKLVLGI